MRDLAPFLSVAASTDFGASETAAGLTQLFIGVDDEVLGVPNDLAVAATDLSQR